MDFTDINSWVIIAALLAIPLAIITIVLAILQYRQRRKKILTIIEFEPIQLVSVKPDVQQPVQILFNGHLVEDVQTLNYTFTNTGVGSITNPEGFTVQKPIHVALNEDAILLSASISNRKPNTLDVNWQRKGNKIVITPVLLLEKNSFSLSIIAGTLKSHPVICHIEDVEVKHDSDAVALVAGALAATAGLVAVTVIIVAGMIVDVVGGGVTDVVAGAVVAYAVVVGGFAGLVAFSILRGFRK